MAVLAVTHTVVICTETPPGEQGLGFTRTQPKLEKPEVRLVSEVKKFRKLTSFASNLKNSALIIFRHQGSSTEIQFQFAREITMTVYLRWNSNKEAQNYTVIVKEALALIQDSILGIYSLLNCLRLYICVCMCLQSVSAKAIISFYIKNTTWNKNYYEILFPNKLIKYTILQIWAFTGSMIQGQEMDRQEEIQIPRKAFHFFDSPLIFEKWGPLY